MRCVPALSLSADTKHARKEKKERGENTERRFALSCTGIRFYIVFLFLYIIRYYTHKQTGNHLWNDADNKKTLEKEIWCSRSLNENTREVTLTLCTQKRVSSLYRSFLNAFVVVLVSRGFANKRARRKRECTIWVYSPRVLGCSNRFETLWCLDKRRDERWHFFIYI